MATGLYSGAAETVHEIPDRQPLSDDFGCVFLSTRIDDDHSFGDKDRREGNVRCYSNVAFVGVRGDVLVSDIRPAFDAHGRQKAISEWQHETMIGDQDRLECKTLGGAEADVLHVSRCGVGVEP